MTPINKTIPLSLKVIFTAFMSVLVPFYWKTYGPSNFLYFCDVALILTLFGIWTENKLLISLPAVGILIPQFIWVVDFVGGLFGFAPLGMTDYMFDSNIPFFARSLSLFHGWLPFLLIYLVYKVGYDKRAFRYWTVAAWILISICYFIMPAPGVILENINAPVNINYVYGFSDEVAQTWMAPHLYVVFLMIGLPLFVYYPTSRALKRLFYN
tara:strand:- start:4488 stop:5120 length:633 start_codon:yes stop_codon:yes gene_type:complete